MTYRKPNRADWRKTAIYLAVYVVTIIGGAFLLLPRGGVGTLVWAVIVAGGLFLLVKWHSKSAAYRCTNCGHEFEISLLTDLVSPHGIGKGGWKYLKCPQCSQRMRAEVLVKDTNEPAADISTMEKLGNNHDRDKKGCERQ